MTEQRLRESRERIGRMIRETREARRLTLRDLAEKAGVKYNYIANVERGEANITIDNLNRITAPLGLQPALIENTIKKSKTMDKNRLTVADMHDATFVTNSDPMLIETEDAAQYALNLIKESDELKEVMPGQDGFDDICARLDASRYETKKVYAIKDGQGTETGYIVFRQDYNI